MDLRHSVIHSNCIVLLRSSDHICFRLVSFHLHQIPCLTSSFISTDWFNFYATLLIKSSAFIEVTKCISNGTACVYATELLKYQLATDGCSQYMLQFIVPQCEWNDSLVHFFCSNALGTPLHLVRIYISLHLAFECICNGRRATLRSESYFAKADEWKRWASKWSLSSVLQPSVSIFRRNFYRVPFLHFAICAQCKHYIRLETVHGICTAWNK